MRGEWLSLLGLYRYDPTILDELALPDEVDRQDLIDNLLVETAEMEIIYPEPEIMRQIIGSWSRARLNVWNRVALVLTKPYDPFVNIRRDETRTIQTYNTNTQTNDITRTDNLTQTGEVSAWDSSTFQNRDKVTNGGTQRNAGTVSDNGNSYVTETYHMEGDSAITDAQDVARKEVELRSRYELDDYIINDFKNRFCLLVY